MDLFLFLVLTPNLMSSSCMTAIALPSLLASHTAWEGPLPSCLQQQSLCHSGTAAILPLYCGASSSRRQGELVVAQGGTRIAVDTSPG